MDALYLGSVMHDRRRPRRNRFRYRVFFVCYPLQRQAELANALVGVNRFGLLSLHDADHGPRDGSPLLPWIRARLAEAGVDSADGEVWLQTFPRVLGYVFNPVSFWYCHDRDGGLRAVLAEVNNTFGGRHLYLLHHPDGRRIANNETLSAAKAFHVSPFCEVSGGYRFRFVQQNGHRAAYIDYDDAQGPLLATSIHGRARPWRVRNLLAAFCGYPLMTFGVVLRIHYQALRLWLKGVPFIGSRAPAAVHSEEAQ